MENLTPYTRLMDQHGEALVSAFARQTYRYYAEQLVMLHLSGNVTGYSEWTWGLAQIVEANFPWADALVDDLRWVAHSLAGLSKALDALLDEGQWLHEPAGSTG